MCVYIYFPKEHHGNWEGALRIQSVDDCVERAVCSLIGQFLCKLASAVSTEFLIWPSSSLKVSRPEILIAKIYLSSDKNTELTKRISCSFPLQRVEVNRQEVYVLQVSIHETIAANSASK